MKILWIGKRPTNDGKSGEEVFDREMITACRQLGYHVDLFHPEPVSRVKEVCNLVLGWPYQRARFMTKANITNVRQMTRQYEITVCSWEPFDGLVRSLPTPTILIAHNISSKSLPSLFPGNPLAKLASMRARLWELGCYRPDNVASVAALSRTDLSYLQQLGAPRPMLLPPGMPPCVPLIQDAEFHGDLVVSGTYGWPPKRRDLMRFAQEYAAKKANWLPVLADGLPLEAGRLLRPHPLPSSQENMSTIRFGLITDRFEAGHKLKTLAYIASNQIVLSFANVSFDFAHVPDHVFFIRKIDTIADVRQHVEAISKIPRYELHDRLVRFKQACAEMFTWQTTARTLIDAAHRILEYARPATAVS